MLNASLLIGGTCRPATEGRVFERRDPLSGDVASQAPAAGVADAVAAVDAAQAAAPAWAALSPSARRALLLKAADALEMRRDSLVEAMMAETGSTSDWAAFNTRLAANMLREAASLCTQVQGDVIPSERAECVCMAVRVPAGVVLGIAPWNAPIILGVRAIALPLACGNTTVLKASELCPLTHALIGEVMQQAGLPPGTVNVVTNAPEDAAAIVQALVEHPAVRRVSFTGSTGVGRIIAQLAAAQLKPAVLELGGKASLLVLDDADVSAAVNAAIFGAFFNQGQICMSTERIVVEAAIADSFVPAFVARAGTLRAGDPRTAKVQLGAVIGAETVERLRALIADALDKGATLLVGGTGEGAVMQPTVLDGVTPRMRIYYEESFGPVVSIIRVRDEEEAIHVANDTEYGLTAAVFSCDGARALRVARRIQTGMCHINGPTVHDEAPMPFGGVKSSGYGRLGGRAGIAEFTDLRWISIETGTPHYPF
ncbi:aldehyde dehydrogenase [Acetobacter conturbans]|uniref:Aldehyde dehydrogenase family protein n=1 Tax=Acetobacter conturbans TaxID=1737472 RepID=A0ABX0K608_9PROT|nr:aldehyde dehydrogenase [Acetobacter conturbans]NHN90088.1 aldehyde dehydrogenase family protein [Acetobacter conturbans]